MRISLFATAALLSLTVIPILEKHMSLIEDECLITDSLKNPNGVLCHTDCKNVVFGNANFDVHKEEVETFYIPSENISYALGEGNELKWSRYREEEFCIKLTEGEFLGKYMVVAIPYVKSEEEKVLLLEENGKKRKEKLRGKLDEAYIKTNEDLIKKYYELVEKRVDLYWDLQSKKEKMEKQISELQNQVKDLPSTYQNSSTGLSEKWSKIAQFYRGELQSSAAARRLLV
jgi:hypothetical protein